MANTNNTCPCCLINKKPLNKEGSKRKYKPYCDECYQIIYNANGKLKRDLDDQIAHAERELGILRRLADGWSPYQIARGYAQVNHYVSENTGEKICN